MKPSILFDMDGVLVDSEPVICAAAIQGLAEFGIHAYPLDFLPFVGAGEDRYIGGVAEKYGYRYVTEMKDRVYQIYLKIVPDRIRVFPGIHELLETLVKAGHKITLASSADRIKINANLRAANIDSKLFSAIISGEDVINKKPSPEIYLKAAAMVKTDPSHCIVVEDALNGIAAARAAGSKCIAVATSFSREQLAEAGADLVCNAACEIYEAVQSSSIFR